MNIEKIERFMAATLPLRRPRPVKAASEGDWFFALDQRRVGTGTNGWVAQVFGIHRDQGDLWIQIAPAGTPFTTMILRLSASTHLGDVLIALEHAPFSESGPAVVDLRG